MNIYQRINEVRKKCPFIKKDKKVEGGGYMAVTHDHLTAELRDHLIDQGIIIVPRLLSSHVADTGTKTKGGTPILRYEARYEVDFVNMDEPADKTTVLLESHANDQGDKAPGKATSYATKYAMLKLFSIESGENEEERPVVIPKKVEDQVHGANVKPNAGAGDNLDGKQKAAMQAIASEIIDAYAADAPNVGFGVYEEARLDVEQKNYVWSLLDSKIRTSLRKLGTEKRKAASAATT